MGRGRQIPAKQYNGRHNNRSRSLPYNRVRHKSKNAIADNLNNSIHNIDNHRRYATNRPYSNEWHNWGDSSSYGYTPIRGNSGPRNHFYFTDDNTDLQQNSTPSVDVSFYPGEFITSTAMRPRSCNRPSDIDGSFSSYKIHSRTNGISKRRYGPPSRHEFHETPKNSNRESLQASSNDTTQLPPQKSLDSRIVDCTENIVTDKISYTTMPYTIHPKVYLRIDGSTEKGKDSIPTSTTILASPERTVDKSSKPDACDKDIPKEAVVTVHSEKRTSEECVHTPGISDIPCGQGDNVNTAKYDDFPSFYSQVLPSLPTGFASMPSNIPTETSTDNTDQPVYEAKYEPSNPEIQSSNITVLSRTHINSSKVYQDVEGSLRTTSGTVTSAPVPLYAAIGNSNTEAELLGGVLDIKNEAIDIIPSSQKAVSLKPSFNLSKKSSPTSTNDTSIDRQTKDNLPVSKESIKKSPVMMASSPRRTTEGHSLTSQTAGKPLSPHSPLDNSENPYLNLTKPINLITQPTCENLFDDLESNPTQNLTLVYSGEVEMPETLTRHETGSPAVSNVDTNIFNVAQPRLINPSEVHPNPVLYPLLTDLCHNPLHENAPTVDTCRDKSHISLPRSSVSPVLQDILYRKYGIKPNQELLCPTKTNLVDSTSNWESFQTEIYLIASEIHTLLKNKLTQLNGSNSDKLVCNIQINDHQNDTCLNNEQYSFCIENKKKFTMEIVNSVKQPSIGSNNATAKHCSEEFVKPSVDVEETKTKRKKKKSSCDVDSTCDSSRRKCSDEECPSHGTLLDSTSSDVLHKTKKRKKSARSVDTDDVPAQEEVSEKKSKHKIIKKDMTVEPVVEYVRKEKKKKYLNTEELPPLKAYSKSKKAHKTKKERKADSYTEEPVNEESLNDRCSRTKDSAGENLYVTDRIKSSKKVLKNATEAYYSSQVKEYPNDINSEKTSETKKSKKSSKRRKQDTTLEDTSVEGKCQDAEDDSVKVKHKSKKKKHKLS